MALTLSGDGDITGLAVGALPSNVIGGGAVLQVVQAISGSVNTTSTSYVDVTGASLSITPSSSSSRILIFVSGNSSTFSAGIEGRGYWRLQRNSTTLLNDQWTGYYFSPDMTNDGNIYATISACYLDSPSTTSATTYKLSFASGSGVTMSANNFTVTALEIAG